MNFFKNKKIDVKYTSLENIKNWKNKKSVDEFI
jgi:hypothetical protein